MIGRNLTQKVKKKKSGENSAEKKKEKKNRRGTNDPEEARAQVGDSCDVDVEDVDGDGNSAMNGKVKSSIALNKDHQYRQYSEKKK